MPLPFGEETGLCWTTFADDVQRDPIHLCNSALEVCEDCPFSTGLLNTEVGIFAPPYILSKSVLVGIKRKSKEANNTNSGKLLQCLAKVFTLSHILSSIYKHKCHCLLLRFCVVDQGKVIHKCDVKEKLYMLYLSKRKCAIVFSTPVVFTSSDSGFQLNIRLKIGCMNTNPLNTWPSSIFVGDLWIPERKAWCIVTELTKLVPSLFRKYYCH